MKLYDLEITIINYYAVVAKFQLTLEGINTQPNWAGGVDEGEWYAPDIAAFFFGTSSGYWWVHSHLDGTKKIVLLNESMPNLFSHLWRDVPESVGWLNDVLKLPLFIGETGQGYVFGRGGVDKFQELRWKVIDRGF